MLVMAGKFIAPHVASSLASDLLHYRIFAHSQKHTDSLTLANDHYKLWEGAAERDPDLFMKLWEMLANSSNDLEWNGDVLYWVDDTGADSRLRIVNRTKWNALYDRGERKVSILKYLPDPGAEWQLKV
jgi:hypothetical protein